MNSELSPSILDKLTDPEAWEEFYRHRSDGGHRSRGEMKELRQFIDSGRHLTAAAELAAGRMSALPAVKELNKKFTGKKRTVFTFPKAQNFVLKLLAHLLYQYDHLFSPYLFSFRQNTGVKVAMRRLLRQGDLGRVYTYKVDIHDYFNSVDTERMLSILRASLPGDQRLCDLVRVILTEPAAMLGKERVEVRKGIMAGVPIAGFLADLYLADLDRYFEQRGILYARYSDDIIVFANTEGERAEYERVIIDKLHESGLTVNHKKEFRTSPGEEWEFLGFAYRDGRIDLAEAAVSKLKAKLRRKARTLVRWRRKNNAAPESAIKAYLKHFNRKFFDNPVHNEVTWALWYFPVITCTDRLREIDRYMQDCIRYIYTGRHTKANYNLRYDDIRALGYRSLVNAYYGYCEKTAKAERESANASAEEKSTAREN